MNRLTAIFLLVAACALSAFGQDLTEEAAYQFLSPYLEKPIELSLRTDYKFEYDLKKDQLQVKLTEQNRELPLALRQFDPTFSVQSWKVYTLSLSQDPQFFKDKFAEVVKKLQL